MEESRGILTLDWNKLRSETNIRHSFEELCCQLARSESVPANSKFVRKGSPDAGVECFWKLPNGKEWGWQTKWFRTSPSTLEWRQIDDSVKKALEKHPNLTKYIVCLPIDRSDARIKKQKTCLDKWNIHVEKWEQIKNIDFQYWGTSEIEQRLSDERNQGRCKYFFDQEFLSSDWFEKHVNYATATAGPRYSPQLNVKLPLAEKFEALGRTAKFYDMLKTHSREISENFDYSKNHKTVMEAQSEFVELRSHIDIITDILKHASELEQQDIDFKKIHEQTKKASITTHKIISKLYDKARQNMQGRDPYSRVETFDNSTYHLRRLEQQLLKINKLAESDSWLVANTGTLLLKGNAGNGKTHLLCDIAVHRLEERHFSVFLHGGHFVNGNPKSHILQELDLNCTFSEFIGALDAAGQASNSKSLIIIDALNEGDGQKIWSKYLPELLKIVSDYPWVAIAISVRTSYEQVIFPNPIESEKLSKFTHEGFGSKIEEAMRIFFDNNGIERPSIPLLAPEFYNPLFLTILCKGLSHKKLTKIPRGLKGLTSVYNFFIDAVNKKLSGINFLDYPVHENIVRHAVNILAKHMSAKNTRRLRYDDAKKYLNAIHSSSTQSKSLIHHMISEGILSEDLVRTEHDKCESYVQFSYERLGDNLIVNNHLKDIKIPDDLSKLFRKNGVFAKYFNDDFSIMQYKGIIDAISIQLPERFSKELVEIRPTLAKFHDVLESFLDSFMWRHPDSINESSLLQIEKHIVKKRHSLDRLFKVLLTISTDPEIIINGKYLHNFLLNLELGDRDSLWSTFLHYNYDESDSIVQRYIDWAWNGNKSSLNPESVYLTSLTLSWFFTSSNRLIRDRATKALVSLLSNHVEIFIRLLPQFIKCNDPYVLERLFCAAYGCSMRNNDKKKLKELADYTYSTIFKNGDPPPDILLRDYAKSIIDYTSHLGVKLDMDYKKVEPPYDSKWIKCFPTENTIKKLKPKHKKTGQQNRGIWAIFHSLGDMGDFYRYVLGANSNTFQWSAVPLLSENKSRETIFEEFEKSITGTQCVSWMNYYNIISESIGFRSLCKDNKSGMTVKDCKKDLRQKLNVEQRKIFDEIIAQYMEYSFNYPKPKNHVDLQSFARWIIKRVFELGWTSERFGEYDRLINQGWADRSAGKPERMGKKYQWIAYSELVSKASDNFEFKDHSFERAFIKYRAPWQFIRGRNIDPSLLFSKTHGNQTYYELYSSWWSSFQYDSLNSANNNIEWLKDASDLPLFESMIEVTNPRNGSKWLILGGYFSLQQKIPLDENPDKTKSRHVVFHLGSCIAKKSDIKTLYTWWEKHRHQGSQFPQFSHTWNVFLGELYWADASQHDIDANDSSWTKYGEGLEELPAKVYVPMHQYFHEIGNYDCSTDENISIFLPNKLLVEKMSLINKNDGTFVNSNDELIAYDPTIAEDGPSVLLIRKDKFIQFLEQNDYGIIWHVIGQKEVLGGWANNLDWEGSLEIRGVYTITKDKIKGVLNTQFVQ